MEKEQTTVRLHEELVTKLKEIAETHHVDMSKLLRQAIKNIVNRYKFDKHLRLIV